MRISILGAGAWGTALAVAASRRHEVHLWARDAAQAQGMAAQRCNPRYLPSATLPAALAVGHEIDAACAHAHGGLVVLATPLSGLRATLTAIGPMAPVLWLCKGFEADTGCLGHEIARELGRTGPCGVLSGPSFAAEVAQGQATALVAASDNDDLRQLAVAAFHADTLRIYTSADAVGVEVGGAMKNVMAIATGMLDGMAQREHTGAGSLGLNARAALITRGLAEMTRLGVALGAQAETFMGLSGLGDLVLTATGALSRNRQLGLLLAEGVPLSEALQRLGHVAEGAYCAATALQRARSLGVDLPITEAVVDVLQGRALPQEAMWRLLSRDARAETGG